MPVTLRVHNRLMPTQVFSPSLILMCITDIGLAVNTGKTKYLEIGRHRGMIANAHIKIDSNSYEKVKNFKYLGSLLTNQNYIQEEIKCRLKPGINIMFHAPMGRFQLELIYFYFPPSWWKIKVN